MIMLASVDIAIAVVSNFIKFLGRHAVPQLLFSGAIREEHKTKFVFNELTGRYKESIKTLNRVISINIGFSLLALYAYLVLPSTGSVIVPFVKLPVSREMWLRLVPLVAYGLQILNVTAFIWFMLLRIGLRLLVKECKEKEDSGDITNIVLNGIIGHIWVIFRISKSYESFWHYFLYIPALILSLSVAISPLFILLFFIVQLFMSGILWLGIVYSILSFPYFIFFFLLIVSALLLGFSERFTQLEDVVGVKPK